MRRWRYARKRVVVSGLSTDLAGAYAIEEQVSREILTGPEAREEPALSRKSVRVLAAYLTTRRAGDRSISPTRFAVMVAWRLDASVLCRVAVR